MTSTTPGSGRAEVNLGFVITVVLALMTLLWVGALGLYVVVQVPEAPAEVTAVLALFGLLLVSVSGVAALLFRRASRLVTAEGAPGAPGLDHAPAERAVTAARGVLLGGAVLTPPMVFAVATRTHDPALDPAEMIGLWFTVMAAVSAAIAVAVAAAEWCAWVYLLAVVCAQALALLRLPQPEPAATAHVLVLMATLCCFVFATVHQRRLLARHVDLAILRSAREVADAASESAATAEAARIDGLVHDHVLAALLLASRADDPGDGPFVRRSAAGALAALSEIQAPKSPCGTSDLTAGVPLSDFAADLLRQARAEDPALTLLARRLPDAVLPQDVAAVLGAAALEAVRNSVRHAGVGLERPVHRRIVMQADREAVTVAVSDDGVGFDLATAPQGRYGVSGSILGRMDGLDGGAGHIETAPGQGTTVVLSWRGPQGHVAGAGGAAEEAEDARVWVGDGVLDMRHLAHVTRDLKERMPRGPRIHGALGAGLGLVAMGVISADTFTPQWPNLLVVATTAAWLVRLLVLWTRTPMSRFSGRAALALGLWTPAAFLVSLVTWQGPVYLDLWLWTVALVYIVPILLCLSDHPAAAWVCAASSGAAYLAWILLHHGAAGLTLVSWLMIALIPLGLNPVQRVSFHAISTAASVSLSHRAEIDVRARETAALNARRTRGLHVDSLARPLLERLAAGERTGEAVRIEAAQLEAHLRDDLRAPCFRDTDVARAAHDARRAGVRVELMDDGALDEASDRLREEVIATSVAVLDAAETGAVVIRVAPPGRDLVATIVASPEGAAPTRLEIHPDFLPVGAGDESLTAKVDA